MDQVRDRGRGMRRGRSRELLFKLLPGNKSRTQLNAEDRSSGGVTTRRGRSRSAGSRLSQLVHNVSTLDFGGLFATSETAAPAQTFEESSTAPVLAPIVIAGPSLDANVRHVEAQHPAQWPGVESRGKVQLMSIDAELMQEVKKRRSVLATTESGGSIIADIDAALTRVVGPGMSTRQNGSAVRSSRFRDTRPRSIAQVLAESETMVTARESRPVFLADNSHGPMMEDPVGVLQVRPAGPCNLVFTLQTELSIVRREHRAQKNELTSRILGLQSLLGASYRCSARAEAKATELTTAVEKLTAKLSAQDSKTEDMEKLLVEAGLVAERSDSKVKTRRKSINRLTRKETDQEVVSEQRLGFADMA
nr:hypothetical protein B0A51_12801 [Rachicladosporium sp. CCFEE 5018]